MGKGWAVGAAASLGLAAAQVALRPQPDLGSPLTILQTIALVGLFVSWAYALAVAAWGSRGAIVALAIHAVAFGALFQGALLIAGQPLLVAALAVANLLVGFAAALSLLREARERRGPLQAGTATFFVLALLVWVFLRVVSAR